MRQLKITKSITNRESKALEHYLQDIGKQPLITAEEEVKLAVRIRAGDQDALDQLVLANLRFVVSVAKQYQGNGLKLSDLINEGNIGLIKAARRFDETRGFKFISYAVWWIRQSILQAISEHSRIIRLPLNQIGNINRINKAFARMEQVFERPPTAEELSSVLEMDAAAIKQSLKNNTYFQSIDAPIREGDDQKLLDIIEPRDSIPTDNNLMLQSLRKEIMRSLQTLSERERVVVMRYFGVGYSHDYTLEEIAEILNITRERARQVKDKAIRKLRHRSRSRLLRTYLGK